MFSDRCSLIHEFTSRRIRLTAQRKVLLSTIQQSKGHMDAASILAVARRVDASIDRATVYRTLKLLKKLRLVDELDLMHLTGEKHFYEAKPRQDHVHITCLECGRIEEYSSPSFERLKQEISRECAFEIGITRLEVGGCCSRCREKTGRGEVRAEEPIKH